MQIFRLLSAGKTPATDDLTFTKKHEKRSKDNEIMKEKIKAFGNLLMHSARGRRVILLIVDIGCYVGTFVAHYLLTRTVSGMTSGLSFPKCLLNIGMQILLVLAARFAFGIYKNVWRYASTSSYLKLIAADVVGGFVTLLVQRGVRMWGGLWTPLVVGTSAALITLSTRFLYCWLYKKGDSHANSASKLPVAVVGAGRLGTYLVGDLQSNPNSIYNPVFLVDVDKTKVGNTLRDLPVIKPEQAPDYIAKYGVKMVIIAITRYTGDELSSIYYHYTKLGCKVRVCESLMEETEEPRRNTIREFTVEDLLFRKTLNVSDEKSAAYYRDKVVLVTGGGGSIGSEICRQIARCQPRRLIIFDIYENNAYDIQQELIRTYGASLDLVVLIGSVRDGKRLESVFRTYRPEVVFHAAAHKHVPLMENSPMEAVKNNVMGTYNTANMAEKYGVGKFILISTDKAVNPTNIMGASKRMCEMIIQCRRDSATVFGAVRFGNVLGSNGSVIPLFRQQIASGGPVTITDKRIVRYFMTIPEASSLVIQAGAMARDGELFVLDMGRPVKIYDLARDMITLSGFEPDKDIEIREVGLRPGEKLYEELLMTHENQTKSENDLIFIEKDTPYTRAEVDEKIRLLCEAAETCDREGTTEQVKEAIRRVIPTFHDPEELNAQAEKTREVQMANV